jgi:hypothetical protein
MKLGRLTLFAYNLAIVISTWCIFPFITMKWPYLPLLTNFLLPIFKVYLFGKSFCTLSPSVNICFCWRDGFLRNNKL